MFRISKASIKRKLMLINLMTVSLLLVLLCGGLIANEFLSFKRSSIEALTIQARMIGSNSTAALSFNDPKTAREILSTMIAASNIVGATIYKNGTPFARYQRNQEERNLADPPSLEEGYHFGFDYLDITQRIRLDGETIGVIYIRSDLKQLYSHLLLYSGTVAAIMTASLFIAFLLLSRLQKAITSPIFDLAGLMRHMTREKDYSRRAEVRGGDEFGTLAEGFNGMLEQIQIRDAELEFHRKSLASANEDLQQELAKRERAEEELQKLNQELELRVKERTQQLLDAQEELVRKEKLAVLGMIAGSVGHEIRNPLGVISNAVFYLKTVLGDTNETTKEYLEIIRNEVAESERIVADLLDFARTKTPQKERVNIQDMISQSLKKCKVPENVAVEADIPGTLPQVTVDPLQMGQVFVNIIKNAAEGMPKGGTVKIKAEEQKGAGSLRVNFTDTGMGISPENLRRLFQPLFTTKARGLGLGLTIVRNLTEANGGRIDVKSDLGKGTTFSVSLPADREN